MNITHLGHGMILHTNRKDGETHVIIRLDELRTTTKEVARFLLLYYVTAYLK